MLEFLMAVTIHQVPPNNDPNSERTVLSSRFTSDEEMSKNGFTGDNLCTFLEGSIIIIW